MSFITYTQISTICCRFIHMVIWAIKILITWSVLVSCAQHQSAPISARQPPQVSQIKSHTVKAGETLYSIAWQYNIDYRRLAAANGIGNDYLIFPGQTLSLRPLSNVPVVRPEQSSKAPSVVVAPIVKKEVTKPIARKNTTKTPTIKRSDKTSPPKIQNEKQPSVLASSVWQWPAKGKVVTNFYSGNAAGKGIDIAGKKGESIFAAAPGKIVYAGNGIRGYGNLVIIRHSAQYLSAYAHNHKINVKEGEQVTGGQRIAELGSTGVGANNRTILHFQVRRNGKPIDPLTILPKRNF